MTDQAAADFQTLFNDMVQRHGGAERLSALDIEIVTICCRTMVAMRSVDPSEASRMAQTVAQLTSTLPMPVADDPGEMMDLRRLTDAELCELQRIEDKACNVASPLWSPDDDLPAEPEITARERCAVSLAQWVDGRADGWSFGGPTEAEMIHMRNEISSIVSPAIAHALYRRIIGDELRDKYEREISRALAASGSDAKVVPMNAEERAQLEPPALLADPPPVNGVIDPHFPPFSFGGDNK